MCGVTGIVDPRRSAGDIRSTLCQMNDVIIHRGPDDAGAVAKDGIGIGMRRLSIIDVAGGQQPIANESGKIHIVCNGEIYNYQELKTTLEKHGHRFSTGSDAEAALHAYEQFGDEFLTHLRGMFGLAIWDQERGRVLIARDRLGKKPMFYGQQGDAFWFGSEMKSILAAEPSLNEPNYATLGHFLQFAFIPEPDTIYRNIHRLPAAHLGIYESGRFTMRPYWSVSFEPDESLSESDWRERLDATIADAVRARLMSEVPLGVFLSGGLDSSAVVAYAHAAGLDPLKTFTVGFDRPGWDESDDAACVARHFGTQHHTLHLSESELSSSFADTLQAIIRHCDEPFGDSSAVPTYHISRLAREHVTVILSGDGGDELFAGYSSYRGSLFAHSYRKRIPYAIGRHILPGIAFAAGRVLPGDLRYRAQRVGKVLADSALPFEQAYRDKVSIWNASVLRDLLTPEAFRSADYVGERYMPPALWEIFRSDRDLVNRLTEIDLRCYLLDDILVKVDRMSMAHSLEVRSPLLDHNVVELAAKIPSRMKIRGRQGKHIFREVVRPKLPGKTLRKGKQGFSVPLRDWFRGCLRDFVHDTLTGNSLPNEIFSKAIVDRTLAEHDSGAVDHANRIWLLLTFAVWHRQHLASGKLSSDSVSQSVGSLERPDAALAETGGAS